MHRVILLTFATLIFSGCAEEPSARLKSPVLPMPTDYAEYRAAASLHIAAYRTHDRAGYRAAIAAYDEFLERNPASKLTYDAFFYDGEARWSIEDWAGAAAKYQRAIALSPSDNRSADAAYANVLASRHAEGITEVQDDPSCTDDSEGDPEPLPDNALPIVAAYDLYLATVKSSPDMASILYSKARILFSCRNFGEAEPLFAKVVDDASVDSETAAAAAAMLLDCLAEQGKTEETFTRAAALEKTPLASSPILAEVLFGIEKARGKS